MIHVRRQWQTYVLVALLGVATSTMVTAAGITLSKGSKAVVQFYPNSTINSAKFEEGDRVPIQLAEPITMGGGDKVVTLVEKGAIGTAVVTKAESAGKGGSPGKLQLAFEGINPKGSYVPLELDMIPLSGETDVYEGKGKKLLSYLFGFGLFISGGQAEVPADTTFEVTITENVYFVQKEEKE